MIVDWVRFNGSVFLWTGDRPGDDLGGVRCLFLDVSCGCRGAGD